MLVWGENNEQHNERLIKLLERLRAIGLQLNKDSCKIGLTEVPYIGHLLSEQGVKPDPSKVDAIINISGPTNKQDLQKFLEMLAYLLFMPNMAEETAPLRRLIEKNVQWHWSDEHQKSLDSLKTLLTKAPVLKYYAINDLWSCQWMLVRKDLGQCCSKANNQLPMPPSPSLNVKSDMR